MPMPATRSFRRSGSPRAFATRRKRRITSGPRALSSRCCPPSTRLIGFAPPKGKWHDTSPMVSLDWQATPDTMLYARVAKGFKSGGFNGRANTVAESTKYDPETVWSYEAGFKTTIAKQLRLNGSIFYNDYKDFQARVSGLDTDPVTGLPSPKLSVLNAGKLRHQGRRARGLLDAGRKPADRQPDRLPRRRLQRVRRRPLHRLRRQPLVPDASVCAEVDAPCRHPVHVRSGRNWRNHDRRADPLSFAPGARSRQHAR